MKVRQVYPLLLAYADDGFPIKGRTRLQKMIFLFQVKLKDNEQANLNFNFVPYNYGPYSSTLQSDVENLIEDGYLEQVAIPALSGKYLYEYKITSKGKKIVDSLLTDSQYSKHRFMSSYKVLQKIKKDANYEDLDKLLKKVYSEHPEYAEFSIYEF